MFPIHQLWYFLKGFMNSLITISRNIDPFYFLSLHITKDCCYNYTLIKKSIQKQKKIYIYWRNLKMFYLGKNCPDTCLFEYWLNQINPDWQFIQQNQIETSFSMTINFFNNFSSFILIRVKNFLTTLFTMYC